MKIPNSAPGFAPKASAQSRFIPREELSHFEAWAPGVLTPDPGAASRPSEGGVTSGSATPPDPLHVARQAGYQDGYRDGLIALEGFKQSLVANTSAQVGALLESVGTQLDALQQALASALVDTATQLARQVVRSELAARPELIAGVAEHALDALMLSARHITLRVHPQDQPLVAAGAADVLAARGARLIADATVQRGGCLIESDLGRVDATLASRWKRGVATIGSERGWGADTGDADAGGADLAGAETALSASAAPSPDATPDASPGSPAAASDASLGNPAPGTRNAPPGDAT